MKTRHRLLIEDPFLDLAGEREPLYLDYRIYGLHVGRLCIVFHQICE